MDARGAKAGEALPCFKPARFVRTPRPMSNLLPDANRFTYTMKYLLPALAFLIVSISPVQAQKHSVARMWNEALLDAIRTDFARPTVHARNLFHTSAAMYDAWTLFDDQAQPYFLGKTVRQFTCPFDGFAATNSGEDRDEVISYVESNAPSVLDQATANEWFKVELIYANILGGRSSEATSALRDLLQNPIPLTFLTSGRDYREAFGYAEYTEFFFRGAGWAEEVFMAFVIDRFDSDELKSDQGARDWLESASLEAIELSQEDGVLSDVAMSMASLFAHMLEQSGEAASAGNVLAKAFDVIAKDPSAYRSETVDSLLVVLEALETSPVSADVLKTIAESDNLDFDTQMAMLRAASEKFTASDGVGIAKASVGRFEGIPVFEAALTIAKAAGDRSFERQLNDGLSKLERSRAQLESVLQ